MTHPPIPSNHPLNSHLLFLTGLKTSTPTSTSSPLLKTSLIIFANPATLTSAADCLLTAIVLSSNIPSNTFCSDVVRGLEVICVVEDDDKINGIQEGVGCFVDEDAWMACYFDEEWLVFGCLVDECKVV